MTDSDVASVPTVHFFFAKFPAVLLSSICELLSVKNICDNLVEDLAIFMLIASKVCETVIGGINHSKPTSFQ